MWGFAGTSSGTLVFLLQKSFPWQTDQKYPLPIFTILYDIYKYDFVVRSIKYHEHYWELLEAREMQCLTFTWTLEYHMFATSTVNATREIPFFVEFSSPFFPYFASGFRHMCRMQFSPNFSRAHTHTHTNTHFSYSWTNSLKTCSKAVTNCWMGITCSKGPLTKVMNLFSVIWKQIQWSQDGKIIQLIQAKSGQYI